MSQLWCSDDPRLWQRFRSSYAAAVAAASAAAPSKKGLVGLDSWWRNELAAAIKRRPAPHMTLGELSRVMKWKLTRGKMRPLQKLVDGNDDRDVQALSAEAFKIVSGSCGALILLSVTRDKGAQRPRQGGGGAFR